MPRAGKIVRYSTEKLQAMRAAGLDQTDWNAVRAMTDAEIEAHIAQDPDAPEATEEAMAQAVLHLQVALEPDVWRWLATQEKDYATQIKVILRVHIAAREAR